MMLWVYDIIGGIFDVFGGIGSAHGSYAITGIE